MTERDTQREVDRALMQLEPQKLRLLTNWWHQSCMDAMRRLVLAAMHTSIMSLHICMHMTQYKYYGIVFRQKMLMYTFCICQFMHACICIYDTWVIYIYNLYIRLWYICIIVYTMLNRLC